MNIEMRNGHTRAIQAAELLRRVHPRHELLGLLGKDEERTARFFKDERGRDKVPMFEIRDITYNALAEAMYEAIA